MIIWISRVSVFYWCNYPNILNLIILNNLPTSANLIFELHNVQFGAHVSLLFPFNIFLVDILLNVRCRKCCQKYIDYLKILLCWWQKWRPFFQIQSGLICLKFIFFIFGLHRCVLWGLRNNHIYQICDFVRDSG